MIKTYTWSLIYSNCKGAHQKRGQSDSVRPYRTLHASYKPRHGIVWIYICTVGFCHRKGKETTQKIEQSSQVYSKLDGKWEEVGQKCVNSWHNMRKDLVGQSQSYFVSSCQEIEWIPSVAWSYQCLHYEGGDGPYLSCKENVDRLIMMMVCPFSPYERHQVTNLSSVKILM